MRLIERWISRFAKPDPTALAEVEDLVPAVVVTGASAGIGLAIAGEFASRGRAVMLVARSPAGLETARATLAKDHPGATFVPLALDVTAADAARTIEAAAQAAGLYVDVLVNCAGVGISGPFAENVQDEIERVLALNVAAASRLMRHLLPGMIARGRGGVINVASLGAFTPGPFQATYYASKAYLVSLTRAVAWECRGRGVRILVVAPGPVETRFHSDMGAETALYRQVMPSMLPRSVARSAVNGYLAGLSVVTPGVTATLARLSMAILPPALVIPLVGWLLAPRRPRN